MPIELLLKELKNLFGIVDSNFKALMQATLSTKHAGKKWVFVKQRGIVKFSGIQTYSETFYHNQRKDSILFKDLILHFFSLPNLKIYTDHAVIYEYSSNETAFSVSIYSSTNIPDIDLIIHPDEKIYIDVSARNGTGSVSAAITMTFTEI